MTATCASLPMRDQVLLSLLNWKTTARIDVDQARRGMLIVIPAAWTLNYALSP